VAQLDLATVLLLLRLAIVLLLLRLATAPEETLLTIKELKSQPINRQVIVVNY
jgi:hypothetical protein